MTEDLKVNGIKVNYFCICRRKLWLFSHHIRLEPESEKVLLGKILKGIREVENLPNPPSAEQSSICRKCAYMDFCWG